MVRALLSILFLTSFYFSSLHAQDVCDKQYWDYIKRLDSPQLVIRGFYNIAGCYLDRGDFDSSLIILKKAEKYAISSKYEIGLGMIYLRFAGLNILKNDYVNALKYAGRAQPIFEKNNFDIGKISVLIYFLQIGRRLGLYNLIHDYYNAGVYLCKKTNDKNEPMFHMEMAEYYLSDEVFLPDSTIYYAQLAQNASLKHNNKILVGGSKMLLAVAYLNKGDFRKSELILIELKNLAVEIGSTSVLQDVNGNLLRIYIHENRKDDANKLFHTFYSDSLLKSKSDVLKKVNLLTVKYKMDSLNENYLSALTFENMLRDVTDKKHIDEKSILLHNNMREVDLNASKNLNQNLLTLSKDTDQKVFKLSKYIGIALGLVLFLSLIAYLQFKRKQKLNRAYSQIQDLQQSRESLFTIIAHDLRSPMNTYLGLANSVSYLIKTGQFERLPKVSSQIDETGLRVSSLLNNLLNWSLEQQGHLNVKNEIIQVNDIIDSISQVYADIAIQKNLILQIECKGNLQICTDRNCLSLIIRNLLDNAIKNASMNSIIYLNVAPEDGVFIITVSNELRISNPGMIQTISNLFASKDKWEPGESGLGIGLVLAKQAADKIHATLKIHETNSRVICSVLIPNSIS